MPRTKTSHHTSTTRPSQVTYTYPTAPSTTVTIALPPNSPWTSGLHWHETHTEYLRIISGTASITLEGQTGNYTSASGTITVPRYARHEWHRANANDGKELVVQEWTDPADGGKEVFFRNLNGVIEDEVQIRGREGKQPRNWWLTWQLFVIFWSADNYPVLFSGLGRTMEGWISHLVLRLCVLLGVIVGLSGMYEEYTPDRLQEPWQRLHHE